MEAPSMSALINPKKKTPLCFVLISLLLASSSAMSWPDGIAIAEEDYDGLRAFKRSLSDPLGFLRSWNDSGPGACSGSWLGIKCAKGKVIAIQLPWRGLGGHISEKIGQLSSLRKLSLHDNSIGGQIPPSVGFLSDLRGLILFRNRFSGEIPPSIGNCLKLQTLDLSDNSLSGKISNLVFNSSKLMRLNLSNNNFSGTIPAGIVKSPALVFLSLQRNALSGPIPSSLGKLSLLIEITLSENQLNGTIPEEIASLLLLETLDISQNFIEGTFPASLCNISSLRNLNLAGNFIKGRLPDSISKFANLSTLSLKMNNLTGEIPATIGSMSNLSQLDLSDNNFTGQIPAIISHLPKLSNLNFSNNNLSGRVPPLLSKKFNSSSFSGNTLLCGYSFATPCPNPAPSPSSKHKRTLNKKELFLISAGIAVAFLLLLLCCFLLCFVHCRNGAVFRKQSKPVEKAEQPGTESGGEFGGKLVHFDGPFVFTADDLLCATAEIMGKSTYGTVYRATLEDGNQVAVKRLREKMAKSLKEFESEASLLGKIRHSNLLALRAYYLGPKGEKLLVFDFVPNGSLSSLMHERAAEAPPDWEGRMRIALGVAKGLAFLHDELNLAHGNLTSSNVLIDENHDAKIGDFGVSKLMTANGVGSAASAAGYRAPEAVKMRRAGGGGKSADVYSFGVIVLELLTGKSPGEAVDLPQWVASIVKEEWTNEVFDLDLMREATGNAGDELLNTLKLALHCVDPSPAARPEIKEVLRQLEEIKPELAAPAVPKEEGSSSKNACD